VTSVLLLSLLGFASADVGAVVEPADVVEQYREYARGKGLAGEETELRCQAVIEGLQLCATIITEAGWRYATQADKEPGLPTVVEKHGFVEADADGVGRYWVRTVNDGREGLFLHSPSLLSTVNPGPLVVAWPQTGVMVAWTPGNPMLDKVVSVGIARMVQAAGHPITAKILRHDGEQWVVWGEARKAAANSP
jgi:hypothetical protein